MASVLNPRKHPRIWYREGLSLEKAGYRVEYLSAPEPFQKDILSRILQQFRFIQKVAQFNPSLVHLHTPELAWVALLLKPLFRYKIVYDRHEAYPEQVQYGEGRNWLTQTILAQIIRLTEFCLYRLADSLLIAEKGYYKTVPKRAVLIRNSFCSTGSIPPPPAEKYLLICGALSQRNGIQEACLLWEKIRMEIPWKLHISGHSQEESLTKFLYEFRNKYPDEVILNGIQEPVPYSIIQAEIENCECGLALFQNSPHLTGKIPSRFYEFIYLQKKLIISGNPEWEQSKFPDNIYYFSKDQNSELSGLFEWLRDNKPFTYDTGEWSWGKDERLLLQEYESLLGKQPDSEI